MMKNKFKLFAISFFLVISYTNAQSDYGIKGGLNYNSTGKLKNTTSAIGTIIDNKGAGKSGFNIGFYGKLDLGPIFIRPEIIYTKTTSEYALNSSNSNYKLSKLDVPVLVGFKLIGPINLFAGPAFQYILDNNFKGFNYQNIKNDYTVGLNFGASIEIGKLGIDVRYERGLNANEANWTNAGETFSLDSRPEQLIIGLSYSLSKSKK